MSWFDTFKGHVSGAEFFGRFIPKLSASTERKYSCVFHHDPGPSMSVNPTSGTFKCFGCGAQGGMLDFFAKVKGFDLKDPDQHRRCVAALLAEFNVEPGEEVTSLDPIEEATGELDEEQILAAVEAAHHRISVSGTRRTATGPIDDEVVRELANSLWSPVGEHARRYLVEQRGLTEETLRRFEVGWHQQRRRIALPVRDAEGRYWNVRLYSPSSDSKTLPWEAGRGEPRLYPMDVMATVATLVLCEGEIDALHLNQEGFAAVTTTGGAKLDWRKHHSLAQPFRGKAVTIAYDRGDDEPGITAAEEIAHVLLEEGASVVRILAWPDAALEACGGKKVDVNDYFRKGGGTREGFAALLEAATELVPSSQPGPAAATVKEEAGSSSHDEDGHGTHDASEPNSGGSHKAGGRIDRDLWPYYYRTTKNGVVAKRVGVSIATKAQVVVNNLLDRGARFFFFENTADAVFVLDGRWHTIFPEDEGFASFWHREICLFGMTSSSGKELIEALSSQVRMHPKCVRVPRSNWGHLDWKTGTLYLCLDPGHANIIRVQPSKDGTAIIDEVPNGTEDVLLRCPKYRARRFRYERAGAPMAGILQFRDLVHRQQPLDEVERLGATTFKLAALLPDLAQRPIAFHCGGEHSGKTSAAQDIEVVIYGEMRAAGFNKPQELWAALDGAGPLICQDNAESRTRLKFGDAYNRLSTGVPAQFRKLYTNNTNISYFPNGSLILTAIESFSMPEDLDRAIEFRFDVKHQDRGSRLPRTEHLAAIREHGDGILSALLEVMSIAILPDIEANLRRAVAFIYEERAGHPKARFDEYLGLMLLWFEALGPLLWDEARAKAPFETKTHFLAFLDRQKDIHGENAATASREVEFLEAIRHEMWTRGPFEAKNLPGLAVTHQAGGACTIGPATTNVLFIAFGIVSGGIRRRMPWDGARQLGQRMAAAAREGGALARAGWAREEVGHAHNNVPLFRYTYTPLIYGLPKEDATSPSAPAGASGASNSGNTTEDEERFEELSNAEVEARLGDFFSDVGGEV